MFRIHIRNIPLNNFNRIAKIYPSITKNAFQRIHEFSSLCVNVVWAELERIPDFDILASSTTGIVTLVSFISIITYTCIRTYRKYNVHYSINMNDNSYMYNAWLIDIVPRNTLHLKIFSEWKRNLSKLDNHLELDLKFSDLYTHVRFAVIMKNMWFQLPKWYLFMTKS